MPNIPQWTVFEISLESTRVYDNPFWDVDAQVVFTAPSGKQKTD